MTLSLLHETELRRIVDKYPLVNELQPLGLRVGAGPKAVQFGFSSRHHKDLRIPRMQGVTAHDFPIPPFSRASLVLIVITIVIISSYIIYIYIVIFIYSYIYNGSIMYDFYICAHFLHHGISKQQIKC